MAGTPRRAQAGLTLVFLAILFAAFLGPISARADSDLVIGGQARIAYANGDDVRLRETPAFNGTLIRYIPEGTVVDVLDGPTEDDEGNLWFEVEFDGDMGFVISDYLALLQGTDEVAANMAVGADAGDVVGSALIANTSGDGVRCRTEPSSGGAVITVVPEGAWVELTGAAGDGWQPINCGGQSGYVSDRYVSYDGSGMDNVGDGDAAGGASTAEADMSMSVGAASVTGAAMVSGTNGDGVNCRSSASSGSNVITILSEGSNVSLRGDARGDWQPVICAGSNGFVSTQFLDFDDGSSGGDAGDAGSDEVTGEAVVDGTNGDGVNCRTRASSGSSVIVILPEGADVTLRGGASGGWQPVFCGGSSGFVSSQYLSTGLGGGGDDGGASGSGDVTGEATVMGTGNGLRCRTRADFDSSVITVLFDGDGVSLRGNVSGDWQPVVCSGSNGFVFADYLDYDGNGGGDDSGSSGGDGPFAVGTTVVVDGTNGDGVRLRSSGSSNGSIVMVVAEGQTATVISGSSGDWVAVTYKSTSGFMSASYLTASTGGGGVDVVDDGGSSSGLAVGDHAATMSDLNLRYDPRMSAGVAAVAPSGTVVAITGGSSGGFYAVDWDGLAGYMSGDYLQFTDRALTERGGSADEDIVDEPDGENGGGGASGNAIVDYAMQYVGYPYVWATRGPSSFDCSGFTYWVIKNTLGIDITAGTMAQINYGTPVSRGSIQPGDLLFFQNTYTWGLSHVGIYIGGGQMVHAANESTGVLVSDINSDYYASRWYGARRVG